MAAIVIEGCDGSGKTTLVEEFVKRGYRTIHHRYDDFEGHAWEFYTERLLEARTENIVFDRLYQSEICYGPVMRNHSRITVEQLRLFNRLLYAMGGCVIFCDVPFDTAKKNWEKRKGKEYVEQESKLREIHDLYRLLRNTEYSCGNAFTYDYTRGDYNQLNDLRSYIDFLYKNNSVLNCGVIGNHHLGKYLIVGEKSEHPSDLAFYSDDESAGFLSRCLWDAGYREHELAFTNALTYEGHVRDLRGIYLSRPKVVIAMGNVAQETCDDQGVPNLFVNHPQYIKRFKSGYRDRYVKRLRMFRQGSA